MTTAPAVLLPGGRVLPGWWRDLASWQPQRLWFASLVLARLEALVERTEFRSLDPLQLGLLRTLSRPVVSAGSSPLVALAPRLEAVLLRELAEAGLYSVEDGQLTAEGKAVLERGVRVRQVRERRIFHFLDGPMRRYLPLLQPVGLPIPLPDGWKCDPAVLETCLRQPDSWKRAHYFPTDITRLIRHPLGTPPADPNEVILVRPEQLLLVLIQVPATPQGDTLLGFVVKAEGWTVDSSAPVLALPDGWREVLPGLADDPAMEDWKRAWQSWSQPRSLPPAEVEACQLEPDGHRLVVRAPGKLIERLRQVRSDALKGEAWVLAGTGRSRAGAMIEMMESN